MFIFDRHEGRTWKTNHRGRLWIAAAAKQPSDDEILECEEMYKNYYCGKCDFKRFPKSSVLYPVSFIFYVDGEFSETHKNYLLADPSLKFPRTYPVSCLLGCVHVEDCLPQNEYRKLYPNGESSSPFVLICRNPVILPIFYPMSGQHKICKFIALII